MLFDRLGFPIILWRYQFIKAFPGNFLQTGGYVRI
jgi:hypothetical protein